MTAATGVAFVVGVIVGVAVCIAGLFMAEVFDLGRTDER